MSDMNDDLAQRQAAFHAGYCDGSAKTTLYANHDDASVSTDHPEDYFDGWKLGIVRVMEYGTAEND